MPTKSIFRSVGEEVRELRLRRNLTQEALALDVGIHTNIVGRLERGKHNPTLKTLYAIAVKLETPLEDLFAGAARRKSHP